MHKKSPAPFGNETLPDRKYYTNKQKPVIGLSQQPSVNGYIPIFIGNESVHSKAKIWSLAIHVMPIIVTTDNFHKHDYQIQNQDVLIWAFDGFRKLTLDLFISLLIEVGASSVTCVRDDTYE